jgi:tRNA pseudouridine38-40 synthase
VCILLGYDGTEFYGSQSQPGCRTVQQELETVLQRLAPGSSRTVFAGRTDRGVHALGQVVSFDTSWRESDERLRYAINSLAPSDLTAVAVETASETFHARYDARWREYRYRIVVADSPPPLERRYLWWRTRTLDAVDAQAACQRFVGRHAFGTFAGLGKSQSLEPSALTRVVRECEWQSDGAGHVFRVVANGFLPQMVRNMVASVTRVAQGDRPAEWIDELLLANDRRVLGEAAPPHGLTLWRVEYD